MIEKFIKEKIQLILGFNFYFYKKTLISFHRL